MTDAERALLDIREALGGIKSDVAALHAGQNLILERMEGADKRAALAELRIGKNEEDHRNIRLHIKWVKGLGLAILGIIGWLMKLIFFDKI